MSLLHQEIRKTITHSKDLIEIARITNSVLKKYRAKGIKRIGYVAGILTSEGEDKLQENINRLDKHTENIRKANNYPVFSSTDIFDKKLVYSLEEIKLSPNKVEEKFREFWRIILSSGYVTDIFMTPGWKRSRGAQDEHKTAKENGLKVHYVE
jgi:hypothetical protein